MSFTPGVSFVFGEIPTAAKWSSLGANDDALANGSGISSGAITPDKLMTGAPTSWPWQSWSPTYSNLTVGDGTVVAKYQQVGKIVDFIYQLTFGSTTTLSASSNISISFPVTTSSDYVAFTLIGLGTFYTSGAAQISTGYVGLANITTMRPFYSGLGGTSVGSPVNAGQVNDTAPFSWGANCIMFLEGRYEAA